MSKAKKNVDSERSVSVSKAMSLYQGDTKKSYPAEMWIYEELSGIRAELHELNKNIKNDRR
ncbi:MAG: hypothetical protein ACTIAG_04515 [Lactobacillus sp.]